MKAVLTGLIQSSSEEEETRVIAECPQGLACSLQQ